MTNIYTVNGKQVEFTQISMIYDGIEVEGLLLHEIDDEFHNGDCITSEIDYLPGDDEEAKTIIENCWWITYWHKDDNGFYISEE